MKVRIAFATLPDGHGGHTVDTARVGTIEDHPDDDAKALIKAGIAGPVTADEVAEWETLEAHRRATAEVEHKTAADNQRGDQADEAPTEPEATEPNVEQPAAGRKLRRNRVSGTLEEDTTATPDVPVKTVAPDADKSPDVAPTDRT